MTEQDADAQPDLLLELVGVHTILLERMRDEMQVLRVTQENIRRELANLSKGLGVY